MFIELNQSGKNLKIGIVCSRFNEDICTELYSSCVKELMALGVSEDNIKTVHVPGALEIPIALKTLSKFHNFDALIALGAIIKGDTYHFEVVSNESARGVQEVQLETNIPIANAILTTYTEDQAKIRTVEKGADAARVALEMASTLRQIRQSKF